MTIPVLIKITGIVKMQKRSGLNRLVLLRRTKGFNLLELMITVSLAGILLMLAVPSFESISNINRLSGTSNELLTTLQVARSESIRRGVRVVVCRSNNPDSGAAATCSTATGNWAGWIVFVDDGAATATNARNGVRDAGETVIRVGSTSAPIQIVPSAAISDASQRITFRPDGLARTTANGLLQAQVRVCVATENPDENARDVSISFGSRTAVAKTNAAGACNAPANS